MKFSCEKVLLQSAILSASRTTASRSSNPAMEGIFIEAGETLSLTGYNMQTGICASVEADIEEKGVIVLNARLFGDIIRRMPDSILYFSADNALHVSLRCGDAHFNIAGIDPQDFPKLPEVDQENVLSLPQSVLRSMSYETSVAISTNATRPIHTGSLFDVEADRLTMVSIDGFRLALRKEKISLPEGKAFQFVVPGAALNEVERICSDTDNPVTISVGQRHILFLFDSIFLICHRLEGEFLNYKNAIPGNNKTLLTVEKSAFISSLDRVSVVISETAKSPVRCVFEDGAVTLSAKSAAGDAKDICPLDGSGGGLEIGFNNRYLMDAFKFAPAEELQLKLNTSISPCVITSTEEESNFLYLVLPVRLKNE